MRDAELVLQPILKVGTQVLAQAAVAAGSKKDSRLSLVVLRLRAAEFCGG